MNNENDYYTMREQVALTLADTTSDTAIRGIHLAMAAAYRRRARATPRVDNDQHAFENNNATTGGQRAG